MFCKRSGGTLSDVPSVSLVNVSFPSGVSVAEEQLHASTWRADLADSRLCSSSLSQSDLHRREIFAERGNRSCRRSSRSRLPEHLRSSHSSSSRPRVFAPRTRSRRTSRPRPVASQVQDPTESRARRRTTTTTCSSRGEEFLARSESHCTLRSAHSRRIERSESNDDAKGQSQRGKKNEHRRVQLLCTEVKHSNQFDQLKRKRKRKRAAWF